MLDASQVTRDYNAPITREEREGWSSVEWSSVQRLAVGVINHALAGATQSVRKDPDSLCDDSRFLLNIPLEDGPELIDSEIGLYLRILGKREEWFVPLVADYLDRIADEAREQAGREEQGLPTIIKEEPAQALTFEMFLRLPVHRAPERIISRNRRPKLPDPRQLDLLAA